MKLKNNIKNIIYEIYMINYNQINNDGDTALISACKNDMMKVALILLEN